MLATSAKSADRDNKGTGSPPRTVYEDQVFLSSQSGTALLDKFSHCLIVKCSAEMLDTLLTTLIRQMQTAPEESKVFVCVCVVCVCVRVSVMKIIRRIGNLIGRLIYG